ncbi:hypothetical protein PUR59_36535 [Streptomyces sp. SP18ES09]|nr:hypothetical protein [Streptomyces sp. SP18ES09]MEE1820508.1 hypothetical protein [Streptomyces sp. SP18ES09]
MTFPLPDSVDALKDMIGREITALRTAVRRHTERPRGASAAHKLASPV